jgi:hypothetical protein
LGGGGDVFDGCDTVALYESATVLDKGNFFNFKKVDMGVLTTGGDVASVRTAPVILVTAVECT